MACRDNSTIRRLAILTLIITAAYFVYIAGYNHGSRETAKTLITITDSCATDQCVEGYSRALGQEVEAF